MVQMRDKQLFVAQLTQILDLSKHIKCRWYNIHPSTLSPHLQFSLCLCLLKNRFHLRRLPNVSILDIHKYNGVLQLAFITSPRTFSFPLINSFCAFAFPCTNFPKSASLNTNVTAAFLPSGAAPWPTVPVSLRSMYHDSCAPALFLRVKAKMALPCLMASLRSASEEERERAISSKAAEEGKSSGGYVSKGTVLRIGKRSEYKHTVLEGHRGYSCWR